MMCNELMGVTICENNHSQHILTINQIWKLWFLMIKYKKVMSWRQRTGRWPRMHGSPPFISIGGLNTAKHHLSVLCGWIIASYEPAANAE